MAWFSVGVQEDHLRRQIGSAYTGLAELLWNAIDAEAEHIRVVIAENELGGIAEIQVIDDGHGMSHDDAVPGFSNLGGSWKQAAKRSPNKNRALHGSRGLGRWRAFAIGNRVRWETVAAKSGSRELTTIEGNRNRLDGFEISDAEPTERPIGTTVVIDGFAENPRGLQGETVPTRLTTLFALHLTSYPIEVNYAGTRLDPASVQAHRADYTLPIDSDLGPVELTVIEWTTRVERYLYLCDAEGVALYETKPQIQAPGFDFTAYLKWAGFSEHENALAVAELGHPDLQPVLDAAKDQLREHFKERSGEVTRRLIEEWKAEDAYPYRDTPVDVVEEAEQELFDVVALAASKAVNTGSDRRSRRLSLELIKVALERDPNSLRHVLTEVLELPQEQLEELRVLLDRTSLTSIISAAKLVSDRLAFIEALQVLVFDAEVKGQLKERSQLHRILAGEAWVFGDEFTLCVDDGSLKTVLEKHVQILGRDKLADEADVVDQDGRRQIVDLMLSGTLEQATNRREHLVVELKAPKVRLGPDELTQIEKYAYAVASDERFNKVDVTWDFILVSNQLSSFAERKAHQSDRQPGLIVNENGVRVWVRTWAQIIELSSHRLKFVRKALNYSPSHADAIAYLRQAHARYLPPPLSTDQDGSSGA